MSLRNIKIPSEIMALWSNIPQIEDVTDQLPKVPNMTWDTYKKKKVVKGVDTGEWVTGPRKPEEIDTIVIHHTASDAPLKNQAKYHVDHQKWPGIGYHLAIDEGRIKQCNDLLSMTFHASGNNTYTVSIVVNADLSKREMTSQERELLYAAILTVKRLLPIKHIVGHNELCPTACPCTSMNQIRKDIEYLEMRLVEMQSREYRLQKVNAIARRIVDLYKKAEDTSFEYSDVALAKLEDIGRFMEEKDYMYP